MGSYTAKQREVLEIIRRTLEEDGIAPTLEELADELGGISRVAVLDRLRALERKGAIRRRARESRAIEILDPDFVPSRGIPVAGTIAAGAPVLAVEEREEISLEDYLRVDLDHYLLRVRGDSMIEDHIVDGDLVLIERTTTARDGEVVVAMVEGEAGEEATLKRLFREGSRIRLQPANAALEARLFPAKQVEIRGVLRGVIRRT